MIEVGSIVVLNSGGPPMSVNRILGSATNGEVRTAICVWSNKYCGVESAEFDLRCLRMVKAVKK